MSGEKKNKVDSNNTDTIDEEERCRLRGNDAFSTGDWERAAELYSQAILIDPLSKKSAKVYSNLAATLCKVGQYDDAADAAERATVVDATWAKGWWRRGVVSELNRDDMRAVSYYYNAYSLDKTNKVFIKALRTCCDKVGDDGARLRKDTETGDLVLSNIRMGGAGATVVNSQEEAERSPGARVWKQRIVPGSLSPETMDHWMQEQANKLTPSSEQWIGHGMILWYLGLSSGLAALIYQYQHRNDECKRRCQIIDRLRAQGPEQAYKAACWQLLGGEFPSNSMAKMLNGVSHLAGHHIVFDLGTSASNTTGGSTFVPVPTCLSFMNGAQMVAMNAAVTNDAMEMMNMLGNPKVIVSEGVSGAILNTYKCVNSSPPNTFKIGTPEEALAYCRQQLRNGKTWDGGIRRFVSVNYRGTIMFGICCRIVGALSEYYKHLKWAREFIERADEEFHGRRDGDYDQKGSCFRTSFQVNFLVMELEAYDLLRGDSFKWFKGAFPLDGLFKLAKKAADAAASPFGDNDLDGLSRYQEMSMRVAFQRKPTALVHALIANVMKRCSAKIADDDFLRLLVGTGLINADDTKSPCAIIAEHYRIAAEAQIPDADDAAILWWGAATNMAEAPETDGFTLGEFRYAMGKADAACRARAVQIFGPDENLGGSYHTESMLVLEHFAGEADSFILPKLKHVSRPNGTSQLEMDGDVLCQNIQDHHNREKVKREEMNQKAPEVEKKHGMDSAPEEFPPSLTVLCVRSLHKSDCSYAKGESDPASIILKAIQAGAFGSRS